jgi:hypothetical protein
MSALNNKRGTAAAQPSGLSIANLMQEMSLQGYGRNRYVPRLSQVLHLLLMMMVLKMAFKSSSTPASVPCKHFLADC